MSAVALRVRDLRIVTADGAELVDGVDLTVDGGQLLGLLGETGGGKTLTARAALGLLPHGLRATGFVRFGSTEWLRVDRPDRIAPHLGTTVGLMLQNSVGTFDPMLRIETQLTEAVVSNGLMPKSAAKVRAANLCQRLGLGADGAIFRHYPHELSGGMVQRAALALTLMPCPRVLVVDEPTSALDANLRVDALRLLCSIAREDGMGLMVISHDLGLVSHFCDTIAVMYAGRLVEAGPTYTVLRAPAHPYTAALISCSPRIDRPGREHLPTIGGEPATTPGRWPQGCAFHPRCADAQHRCQTERPISVIDGPRRVSCHFPRHEEQP